MSSNVKSNHFATTDFLLKAAWFGFPRSMLFGFVLQSVFFVFAPQFPGSTVVWRFLFGFTALTMLVLSLICRYQPQLYKHVYVFLIAVLSLGQLERFYVLWGNSSTIAAITSVNLLSGFSVLSTRLLSLFLAATSILYGIWLLYFSNDTLINTSSLIYLLTLPYAFVIHFRFKANLIKQMKHADTLDKRSKELELLHEKYLHLSQVDELTGIYNRRYFLQEAERQIALAKRHNLSYSIIIFDLDHFKQINDTKSHMVGDKVLKEVTTRVKAQLRQTDTFARYGGEEFVILLPLTNLEAAFTLAERIRKHIAETAITMAHEEVWVSSSFGLAVSESNCDLKCMLLRADKALYQAKDKGRNRVEVAKSSYEAKLASDLLFH